jgi:predicted N-acyltransferase
MLLLSAAFQLNVSSLHITFPSEGEFSKMKDSGLLQRIGLQYHWRNRNYKRYANMGSIVLEDFSALKCTCDYIRV